MPSRLLIYSCLDCGKEVKTRNRLGTSVCKSCNAKRNLKTIRELKICGRRLRPFEHSYRSLLRTAKKTNKEVLISYEEFLNFTNTKVCHYCNGPIKWLEYSDHGKHSNYFLDRKDSDIHYALSNLVVCCPKCNRIKSNEFTYQEFIQLIEFIKQMRGNDGKSR